MSEPVKCLVPYYYWAWPDDWDGEFEYDVFDCPRLWFRLSDLNTGPDIQLEDNRIVVAFPQSRGVWICTGDEDTENAAVLAIWPD